MLIPAKALFLVVAGMRVQKIRLRFLFLWRALFSFISARQQEKESREKQACVYLPPASGFFWRKGRHARVLVAVVNHRLLFWRATNKKEMLSRKLNPGLLRLL